MLSNHYFQQYEQTASVTAYSKSTEQQNP